MNRTFFAFAMQHFSLIDLKTFHAVADEGNLTRGAARVHLSPSTVCARIKGLESSLGVPLFTRSAQGMAVTPASARIPNPVEPRFCGVFLLLAL